LRRLSFEPGVYGFHAVVQWQWGEWVLGVEAALTACFRECREVTGAPRVTKMARVGSSARRAGERSAKQSRRPQQAIAGHASGRWHGNGSSESWPFMHTMFMHQPSALQLAMQAPLFSTTRRCETRHEPGGRGFLFAAHAISAGMETTNDDSTVISTAFAITLVAINLASKACLPPLPNLRNQTCIQCKAGSD
jgi:hypothetical protein